MAPVAAAQTMRWVRVMLDEVGARDTVGGYGQSGVGCNRVGGFLRNSELQLDGAENGVYPCT